MRFHVYVSSSRHKRPRLSQAVHRSHFLRQWCGAASIMLIEMRHLRLEASDTAGKVSRKLSKTFNSGTSPFYPGCRAFQMLLVFDASKGAASFPYRSSRRVSPILWPSVFSSLPQRRVQWSLHWGRYCNRTEWASKMLLMSTEGR